jgi:DNA-binding response OmpR family regulator
MKLQLLYFDDQPSNIECYQSMLQGAFIVNGFTDTTEYEKALKDHKPHGIILDLHMPVWDGLTLHDKIINSENYNGCPIFFISGDPSDEMRLKTIQTGGRDFFNRQVAEEELKLRLNNKIKLFLQGDTIIDIGNLRMDTYSFNVTIEDKTADLTLFEMRILSYLLRKMPDAVHKNELVEQIWGNTTKIANMSVHISNMKLKLWDWNHEIRIINHLVSIVPL